MGIVDRVSAFAGNWWFPWIVGIGSGVNMFTLVFGGVLAATYVTAILARPKYWFGTAVINAFGTIVGVMAVVYLVELNGNEYITERFPSLFNSKSWKWVEENVTNYGALGVVLTSIAPIVLHPLILFSMLAKMNSAVLVGCIFIGRILKYSIMAKMALTAPHLLKSTLTL